MRMRYNRLGKTKVSISAVGFGTCQLRLLPEQQALDTLKRSFELGVNWVHTAPDYEGADTLVAQAIAESGRDIIVFSQGYGGRAYFEHLFEDTCRRLKKRRLEVFGIACIEDREYLGEPVWGPGGIVEFLQAKQQEGRIGGLFCTTHGTPDYIIQLISTGIFDAVMLAYNPLGFHLLSYKPGNHRDIETITETRKRVFPVAQQRQVSLLVMKPLAGGLLTPSHGFPPRRQFCPEADDLKAGEILRFILKQPGVCAVVPGTTSVVEAEENALAGYDPVDNCDIPPDLEQKMQRMQTSLCSRCGYCDALCSQALPVSWLFRDAYINHYPSETFETPDEYRYFQLHPQATATCSTCIQQTCHCPYGIDIPARLKDIHQGMTELQVQGLLPKTSQQLNDSFINGAFKVQVVSDSIPRQLQRGVPSRCHFYLHNAGDQTWKAADSDNSQPGTVLVILEGGKLQQRVRLRHNVPPGTRCHFTFELLTTRLSSMVDFRFLLMTQSRHKMASDVTEIAHLQLYIDANDGADLSFREQRHQWFNFFPMAAISGISGALFERFPHRRHKRNSHHL